MVVKTFQILGRMKPSEKDPNPKVYRMKLFAANDVVARSKFWYFIRCVRARRVRPHALGERLAGRLHASARRGAARGEAAHAGAGRAGLSVQPSTAPAGASVPLGSSPRSRWPQAACRAHGSRHAALRARARARTRPRHRPSRSKLRRVKKAHGQILSCHELIEKNRRVVKNYGVWLRYESRTGTHNMYKEYRECSINAAIQAVYNDLAGRNRAAPRGIQIIRTAEVKPASTKRANIQQFHDSKIAFPLAHRIMRTEKRFKSTFKAQKPNTYY